MKQIKTQLIGITGTAGAGKDVVAGMLNRLYGAENLSTADLLRAVVRFVYRLPAEVHPVREQMFIVGTFLRSDVDPAALVKVCILQANIQKIQYALLTGMRTVGEAAAIRAGGGVIVGVDAEPKVRYSRLAYRSRDADAAQSFEDFVERDELENKGAADSGDLRGVRAILNEADIMIDNNGTFEQLEAQVREKLDPLFSR